MNESSNFTITYPVDSRYYATLDALHELKLTVDPSLHELDVSFEDEEEYAPNQLPKVHRRKQKRYGSKTETPSKQLNQGGTIDIRIP